MIVDCAFCIHSLHLCSADVSGTECPAHCGIAFITKYDAVPDISFLNRMLWDISRHALDPVQLIELNLGVC